MARTPSNMLPLNSKIEEFKLFDTTTSQMRSLSEITSQRPFVVMFICNHCPFVIHLHQGLKEVIEQYKAQIDFIAISSNDTEKYPLDRPELMTDLFLELDINIPYLYDEEQEVAKQLNAACTPDFYLFDESKVLVYRGQFDESRPESDVAVTGQDLRIAIDLSLKGDVVAEEDQKPSIGCNIKWR